MTRRLLALAALALLPLFALPSKAAFTATSTHTPSTLSTAAVFDTVTVSLTDPGSPKGGTVTLAATASSARGITEVRFQTTPAGGGTWTDACVATTAPYQCGWSTTAVADGLRDVRAVASDGTYTATSTVASRRIDNTKPAATLAQPVTPLKGDVAISATASDAVGIASVLVEYRRGTAAWATVCTRTSSPASCTWSTAGLQAGTYELRATATDTAGNVSVPATRTNLALQYETPAPAMTDPPAAVSSGPLELSVSASDPYGAGIKRVEWEAQPVGSGTWYAVCSDTTAPYTCVQDTTTAPDGQYDIRAVTVDNHDVKTYSAPVRTWIDNGNPTGTLTDPGSPLTGTVGLTATASDAAGGTGVTSVVFQSAPNSATWSTLCTDTQAPYTCAWSVPAADQLWDLRVAVTDGAGHTTYSTVQDRIGGTPPSAVDVQGQGNGNNRLDAGDRFAFTYSEAMSQTSILPGWTGTSGAVVARIVDNGSNDTLTVWNAGDTAITGLATSLNLNRNAVGGAGAKFTGTLTRAGAVVTLTLGTLSSGSTSTSAGNGTLVWTPSATARDVIGFPALTTAASESGTADNDF